MTFTALSRIIRFSTLVVLCHEISYVSSHSCSSPLVGAFGLLVPDPEFCNHNNTDKNDLTNLTPIKTNILSENNDSSTIPQKEIDGVNIDVEEVTVSNTSKDTGSSSESSSAVSEDPTVITLKEKIQSKALTFEDESDELDRINPIKLLRILAPKIPAIKRAPDFTLRITGASAEEASAAAYAIYLVARKAFSNTRKLQDTSDSASNENINDSNEYYELINDRRFQQLVECALCGMDVELAMKLVEEETELSASNDEDQESCRDEEASISNDGPEKVHLATDTSNEEETWTHRIKEGLSVLDASLLAWSLALLGVDDLPSLGNESPTMILSALANRCKRILKSRCDTLFAFDHNTDMNNLNATSKIESAERLAKDAASVCWAFACVKGCTNVCSDGLFKTCYDILYAPLDNLDAPVESVDQFVDRLSSSDEKSTTSDSKNLFRDNISQEIGSDLNSDRLAQFLSLNGIIDVIWACALHGRPKNELRNLVEFLKPIILSELEQVKDATSITKSEMLFKNELQSEHEVQETNDTVIQENVNGQINETVAETSKNNDITSSPAEASHDVAPEVVIISEDDLITEEGLVEVVDAAALLAAESQANAKSGIRQDLESMDSDSELKSVDESHTPDIPSYSDTEGDILRSLTISPRDMCSLAWAFTELDTDASDIVCRVVNILKNVGPLAFSELEGRDLSNLVWSIARCDKKSLNMVSHVDLEHVLNQAGEWLLFRLGSKLTKLGIDQDTEYDNLDPINPTDLSRALWSFSICFDKGYFESSELTEIVTNRLALEGLHLASTYINYFTAEDLTRVLWAYVISGVWEHSHRLDMSYSIGQVIAAIEMSLIRWETGQYSSLESAQRNTLDKVESYLPPISDLHISPPTLCKGVWAIVELNSKETYFQTSSFEIFRIVSKIFSFENGKQLEYLHPEDIVRLCSSYVKTRHDGRRRASSSSLIKKITEMVNDKLIDLNEMKSGSVSELLWSLSEAGVKCNSNANTKRSNIISLELVITDVSQFHSNDIIKMLQGLVGLEAISSMVPIQIILDEIKYRLSSFSTNQIISMMVPLMKLQDLLLSTPSPYLLTDAFVDNEQEGTINYGDEKNSTFVDTSETIALINDEMPVSAEQLAMKCIDLINLLSEVIAQETSSLSIFQMNQILQTLISLPFQLDILVKSFENENDTRSKVYEARMTKGNTNTENLQNLLKGTEDCSVDAAATTARLKVLLENRLSTDDENSDSTAEINNIMERLTEQISRTAAVSCKASNLMKNAESFTFTNTDAMLRSVENRVLFEAGRCKELLENYKRIEFVERGKIRRKNRLMKDSSSFINKLKRFSRIFK